eukprot:324288_1
MSQLKLQRETMKLKWRQSLAAVIERPEFQNDWNNKLQLSQYHISSMKEHHMNEILTILCYAFSCLGGPNNHQILMTSPIDSYERFKHEIEHTLKTGFNFVILDKNNKVVALYYGFDYLDQPSFEGVDITSKFKYIKELHKYAFDNCEYIQKAFNYNVDKYVQYGDIFCGSVSAVRPDIKGKGFILKACLYDILSGMVGYKYEIADCVNRITIRSSEHKAKLLSTYFCKTYDFRNFTFSNGENMQNIIDQLALKYKLSDEYVEYMRNNCKQSLVIHDFTQIKSQFASEMDKWLFERSRIFNVSNRRKQSKL